MANAAAYGVKGVSGTSITRYAPCPMRRRYPLAAILRTSTEGTPAARARSVVMIPWFSRATSWMIWRYVTLEGCRPEAGVGQS